MKKFATAFLILFALMTGGISAHGHAAEKAPATPKIEPLESATMEKLATVQEPSAEHHILGSLNGTWHYTLQYWAKEGADAQTSSGTMTNEMILGGRFLSSRTSLIMNIGGQNIPYEGRGILGFDTANNTFTSSWADTIRTGIMTGTGKLDEKRRIIEEEGRFTDPLTGKEQTYRSELQFGDGPAYKRTVFIPGKSGKEFKVLEIEFSK